MAIIREEDSSIEQKGIVRPRTNRSISHKLDLLDQKMDGLYKDIYISRADNKQNLDSMIDNLDSVIDKLQGTDASVSGMSELMRRINDSDGNNTKKLMNSVQDLFNDQNLIGSLFANDNIHNYIAAQNHNYDMICKYLPRLQDALEIMRDNVLCSDNFSKMFINPKFFKSSKEENIKFNSNTKRLEKSYQISEFLDRTWMNAAKYGEDFIYIVPYNTAFKRLFDKQKYRVNKGNRIGQVTLFEGYEEGIDCVSESFNKSKDFETYVEHVKPLIIDEMDSSIIKNMPECGSVKLHFNTSGVIRSSVKECVVLRNKKDLDLFTSLSEAYFGEKVNIEDDTVVNEAKTGSKMNSMFDNVKDQNRKFSKNTNVADGLYVTNPADRDPDKLDKDFLGAVVERIKRENILPVYLGKKCLGYYYFEFAEDPNACGFCGGHHTTPMIGNGSKVAMDMTQNQQELAIRYIASRISQSIDTKFINANKDLKEEIYALLNYNDKFDVSRTNDIGVSFIPAEDIVHCYFQFNEDTHRGISMLSRAVMPSMLYILLYLTDIIGKITRSTDKRVYYVKQNVETNVAKTMMNVVQQIKKGNFGVRQIESMNNILNIVGKYNDYIIALGPSGDPPIQFEVMQGQDIQTPTEIMEKMEEAAVNTIMPMEFVNSTMQQDFAVRFTMSNTRFMKSIYTIQRKTESFFSRVYTKIYNYEFGENIPYIETVLSPPTYMATTNISQLFDNITQLAEKICEDELSTEEDDVKTEFKKLYVREQLGTYIDFTFVERIKQIAKVNVEQNKSVATKDGSESDMNDIMDDSM